MWLTVSDKEKTGLTVSDKEKTDKSTPQPAVVGGQGGGLECPDCSSKFSNASNLRRHERTHHGREYPPVICVDAKNGIFVTPKDPSGPRFPVHMVKSVVEQKLACELAVCRDFMKIATESGNPGTECQHLRRTNESVCYSAPPTLTAASLQLMVNQGLFSTIRQRDCEQLQRKALSEAVDCVFPIFWKGQDPPEKLMHFSVFTERPQLLKDADQTSHEEDLDEVEVQDFDPSEHQISVYVKKCPVCHLTVRFQEYTSGFHNYDNRVFLTIPLCSLLTAALGNHIAVGRFLHTIEAHSALRLPIDTIRKAFQHFCAFREYDYSYSCVRCGHSPPVLIADANWKVAFDVPVHLFKRPDKDHITSEDVEVNMRVRWECLEKRLVASGFCTGTTTANPYNSPLAYSSFTPWLGERVRVGDVVPKTEALKGFSQKDQLPSSLSMTVDEDTILTVLDSNPLNRDELVRACSALGVSGSGSITDLVHRLEELLLYKDLYPKMFIKLQKTGGGVLHLTCPHAVVYYHSPLWWQESARDHGDALLSFKHPPTFFISDVAGRVARHVNNRTGQQFFRPNDGRLCASTPEYIAAATEKRLQVSVPWINSLGFTSANTCVDESSTTGRFSMPHPVTGTDGRYSLYDRFHQKNQKRPEELLRSLKIVPDLALLVNSSVAEQLNRELASSRYFLCQMKENNYMFSLRLLFHLHNVKMNNKYIQAIQAQSNLPLHIGLSGTLRLHSEGTMATTTNTNEANPPHSTPMTAIQATDTAGRFRPDKSWWGQPLNTVQLEKLEDALGKLNISEVAYMEGISLTRSELLTIAEPLEVEGQVRTFSKWGSWDNVSLWQKN
ncbi:uncharacterized protein LOC134059102 [Sardina pilchardus]|uniref:uncharacterized protein LOC134059102 n=1 Tax=Sardina pilchardus TaxID=27697 RepID=UPI002E13F3DC